MSDRVRPNMLECPTWHPDFGDPKLQFEPLQLLASELLEAIPTAFVSLEMPEPGLLFLRGELRSGKTFEVHSTTGSGGSPESRLAVFISPDTDEEEEIYFHSSKEVIAYLLSKIGGA